MLCGICGHEIMEGAAFCPHCGGKVVRGGPGDDGPVYQADVKRVLKSGKLVVYRDRTEFMTSSVQKSIFSYQNLVAIQKEWDHIDFITEDGHKESCPADRKCVHEAFMHIEQMAAPYLARRKDQLLSQGTRYSFPSSQGMLNDGVLNISDEQAEFRGRSGKNEVIPFREVKSVSAFAGTLDLRLFDRRTRSFAISRELREEVLAFVNEAIAPLLAQRKEALLARGIYFSFPTPEGGAVDLFADRVERKSQLGQTEAVFFRDVLAVGLRPETLELALTDGTSVSFFIDDDEGNDVLLFVRGAIEPYVRARTEGFDKGFGRDERIEINEERGVFHIIRQGGREVTGEWPLEALAECRWEERKDLNALGSVVSGGIALFKSASRAVGSQSAAESEERISCAGVAATIRTQQRTWTETVWFGLFPTGISRTSKKFDQYLTEWAGLSDYLRDHCPGCGQIGPASMEPEGRGGCLPGLPQASGGGAAGAFEGPDAASQEDYLDIAKDVERMSRLIDGCRTPMTIAFQGNRGGEGSGVLGALFSRLRQQGGNYWLWLDVTQLSQGESGEALSLALGKRLAELLGDGEEAGKGGAFITNLAGLVTGTVAGDSSIGKEMVGGLLGRASADSSDQLVKLFAQKAESLASSGKVVPFVTGLDWFAPARVVDMLEALRPFLACRNCVFVIATDYSTVLGGLRERYGQGFDENRGRDFFDGLFKMRFRILSAGYSVEDHVKSEAEHLGIPGLDEAELGLYVSLIRHSVGEDRRSVQRLFASFQQIKSMADSELYESRYNRLVLFAMLCMQMRFREIYDFVLQKRDSVTPEFLTGLCGWSAPPWDQNQVSDEEDAAFPGFGGVFARIVDPNGDAELSQNECQAFARALEFSSIIFN